MEEYATCSCGEQEWLICKHRIECAMCGKEYEWPLDEEGKTEISAADIIHLTNDNL